MDVPHPAQSASLSDHGGTMEQQTTEQKKLQIRQAKTEEALLLGEIENLCFPPAEAAPVEEIVRRMQVFPENFLVADLQGRIVGFINGGTADEPRLPDAMYHDLSLHKPEGAYQTVFGLNVLPEYRRRGIATSLVKAFVDLARRRNKKGMVLTCKEHLIPFYESCGFENYGKADSVHGGAVWYDMRILFE